MSEELDAERVSDVSDRASAEEAALREEAERRRVARSRRDAAEPRSDGLCACGCGNEVDPRRLALGLGRAVECQEKLERYLKERGR